MQFSHRGAGRQQNWTKGSMTLSRKRGRACAPKRCSTSSPQKYETRRAVPNAPHRLASKVGRSERPRAVQARSGQVDRLGQSASQSQSRPLSKEVILTDSPAVADAACLEPGPWNLLQAMTGCPQRL